MSKEHPGLTRIGNVFYIRKRVPKELVSILDKEEINRSLDTKDLSEARKRYWPAMEEIQSQFREAEARYERRKKQPVISRDEAHRLAREKYENLTESSLLEAEGALGDEEAIRIIREIALDALYYHLNGPEELVGGMLLSEALSLLVRKGYLTPPEKENFPEVLGSEPVHRVAQALRIEYTAVQKRYWQRLMVSLCRRPDRPMVTMDRVLGGYESLGPSSRMCQLLSRSMNASCGITPTAFLSGRY